MEFAIKFDERFKVTLVTFFCCRFWLIRLSMRQFYVYKCYIESFLNQYYIKTKWSHNNLIALFEKSRTVSFASSIMKNIVEAPALPRSSVKLICCIAFGSASSFCRLI